MAKDDKAIDKSESPAAGRKARPPVVVILGHVDHGKTTLLDAIRKTEVAAGEFGGITQKIGAYQVQTSEGKKLTFIDTPGHEAFTKMRSRGAAVADIAVLVVAANDSVMPQTVESIKIIQEAKVPYIVAINKVDLPEANVDKVIQDLLRRNVLLENYGGEVPFVRLSAKSGAGVKELLELIDLLAQVKEISGDPEGKLAATIIESRQDKNRGPLATVVVKNGTLAVGDRIFVEHKEAKVRALTDYTGAMLREAGPGTPVEVLGLAIVPSVGEPLTHEDTASLPQTVIPGGAKKSGEAETTLNLILKADTIGSLEAILGALPTNVRVLISGTGEISEADILLAKTTSAVVLGFNIRVSAAAAKLSETEKVLARTYKIIYELLEELQDAANGLLSPQSVEEILGSGKIIAEFPFDNLRVAGVKVGSGRLARGDLARVTRGDNVVGSTKIRSLRVLREEVSKVDVGKECGVLLEPQVDFRPGDDIISYRI